MIARPVLGTILLKRSMPLPTAILCPSPLLLPGDGLLLGALGLRSLLLPSLLLLLLGGLRLMLLRLLRPLLLLLGLGGLRVLLLRLRLMLLLLCGWRAPFFFLLGGTYRLEEQEQGGGTGSSNELHSNPLH
jgi:hypothetical protein